MLQKVISYVQQNNMLKEKDKVVIGISGGADSVCLFFMLLELKKLYNLELYGVHVNHGIRGKEADQDEEFVKALAAEQGVPVTCVKTDVRALSISQGMSEEETGRMVRYEAFYDEYHKHQCNKIAVAHHENDQAETILFQLFRGSGLRGLAGIPPVRNEVIRPLLCVTRTDIEHYLTEKNITYQIDKTNLTDDYTRNKIRHNILSYATEHINAKSVEHIAMAAGMVREAEEYIEKSAQIRFKQIVSCQNGQYSFDVGQFSREDVVIQKGIVRIILRELVNQLKDMEAEHINMILGLLEKQVGKQVNLPYQIIAVREYESVYIKKKEKTSNGEHKPIQFPVSIPGKYPIPDTDQWITFEILETVEKNRIIPKNHCTKWFDYDRIKNTIFIRNRKVGDFIQIDGLGGHKKLKDLFIDRKVPKEERNHVLLLADASHIIWILGDRISEYYKVREDTTRILKVTIDGGIQDAR